MAHTDSTDPTNHGTPMAGGSVRQSRSHAVSWTGPPALSATLLTDNMLTSTLLPLLGLRTAGIALGSSLYYDWRYRGVAYLATGHAYDVGDAIGSYHIPYDLANVVYLDG